MSLIREPIFTALGVETPAELALVLPLRFDDNTRIVSSFSALKEPGVIAARRLTDPQATTGKRGALTEFMVADDEGGEARCVLYGPPKAHHELSSRSHFYLRGQLFPHSNSATIYAPALVERESLARVVAVYRRVSPFGAQSIAAAIAAVIDEADFQLAIAAHFRAVHKIDINDLFRCCDWSYSAHDFFSALHLPLSTDQAARMLWRARRIAAVVATRPQSRPHISRVALSASHAQASHARMQLEFNPTDCQKSALAELTGILGGNSAARVLISGDVGTGKTYVYGAAVVAAARQGWRVAVIVPNALLTDQVAKSLSGLAPELNIQRVVAGTSKQASSTIVEDNCGTVYVGTTAIASLPGLIFDLVVADECQKFSRAQMEARLAPGGHLIEATATCIPRTQALIEYGDTRVLRLLTRPFSRQVRTCLCEGAAGRREVQRKIRDTLADNAQVAIIYSLVQDDQNEAADCNSLFPDEARERKGATNAYERLKSHFGDTVVMIHGRMSALEKQAALDGVCSGEKKVLVSTTVIEVGVTLPSLRLLIVMDPDRHGLSTLHQMRGRVARHGGHGEFVLFSDKGIAESSRERLQILTECDDGFVIAQRDLMLRGAGDVLVGSKQSGKRATVFPNLKLSESDIRDLQAA